MSITTLSALYEKARYAVALNKAQKAAANKAFARALALAALCFVAVLPDVAMAAPWNGAADGALAILNGGLMRTVAIIAVAACGIAGLAGKLSWDWAFKIVLGIVLIFGGPTIVDYFVDLVG